MMIEKETDNRRKGLTAEEVEQSRAQHGDNLLTPPARPSLWKLYLEKLQDPVVKVLLVAAACSLCIAVVENDYTETIGILAAILLATGIAFGFEYDANRKFDLLNAVNEETPVKVIRDGAVREIARREVVVGDVVLVETGDEVPADGELIEAVSLQINESSLTGEPSVNKTTHKESFDPEATYPSNRVMRGTSVMDGHGTLVVDRVGDATEIGKVARQSTEEVDEPTPLNKQLTRLANLIGRIGFSVAALAFLILFVKGVWMEYEFSSFHTFSDWLPALKETLDYFMMSVTLVVVAVPEGLPMSITLSLALNMRRMLSTNNLVRKMHASETMGAVTVICTDKTGTLTQNRMQVAETCFLHEDQPATRQLIFEGISTNTTAYLDAEGALTGVGNPTEVALLGWMQGKGVNYLELRNAATLIRQIPFSTERKYMASWVDSPLLHQRILYVKGAPEVIMARCLEGSAEVEQKLADYQAKAMRTLGFAYRILPNGEEIDEESVTGLTFMGIVAISDPVRPEVPDAIRQCREAGIAVKIVTGDTPGTATEIARQIGLWGEEDDEEQRITGTAFEALTDEEALHRITSLKVMSRARPADKQRLVRLLQQRGEVVAVTGDGTNDAPALNRAQVGLSMGSGTSVAKEASDITLLDDSFSSICTAVMWGRSLYKNIQRFILFQLTINFVALFVVLVGSLVGTELPLTVTQMLWVNLIMDSFAALALASIAPDVEVMKQKPRKSGDFIISPAMWWMILGMGTLFYSILLGLLAHFNKSSDTLTTEELTLFFTLFVMLQFWNLFNAKAFGTHHSAFHQLSKSYGMELTAVAILVGQVLIVQFGGEVFRTQPLSLSQWGWIVLLTSPVLWIGELVRAWLRHRDRIRERKANARACNPGK